VNHGDFHIGNMIINNGHIGIIDFDKNEIADPYDDFKPFCWNVFASPYFETGLINGYFNKQIPENFFPILAVYAAESLISHLPWAIRFGEEEMKVAYQVMDAVFEWYDGFNRLVPTWYKGILF
ncbi:MAG: phosphotransferase, partial [Bacilli bacterium]